ncbi:MAG: hypothetical protein L3J82_01190 [Planctomycetes bacterium]|nr:hypothetical protein [Planctomycetota bacterium]
MRTHHLRGFSLKELLVVATLTGLIFGVLLVFTGLIPARTVCKKSHFDPTQLKDIMADLTSIETDKARRERLSNIPEVQGYKFYDLALRNNILTAETMGKLVSLTSKTDMRMDTSFFDDESIVLEPENCSWTAPKSSELLSLLAKSGKHRKVVICFNSRNWNNTSEGVLLQFSDGSVAEYYDLELMYDIYPDMFTQEDWADGSNIIGKKPPFDKTFD